MLQPNTTNQFASVSAFIKVTLWTDIDKNLKYMFIFMQYNLLGDQKDALV